MWILDYAVLLAFSSFIVESLFQIRHTLKRKSSADISITGVTIRFLAGIIFVVKYLVIKDLFLLIGQVVFSSVFLVLLILVIIYRR